MLFKEKLHLKPKPLSKLTLGEANSFLEDIYVNNPEGRFRDDQGKTGYCTRFALALAIRNGFLDKGFFPGQELDFQQNSTSQVLVNEHKVGILNYKRLYIISSSDISDNVHAQFQSPFCLI